MNKSKVIPNDKDVKRMKTVAKEFPVFYKCANNLFKNKQDFEDARDNKGDFEVENLNLGNFEICANVTYVKENGMKVSHTCCGPYLAIANEVMKGISTDFNKF